MTMTDAALNALVKTYCDRAIDDWYSNTCRCSGVWRISAGCATCTIGDIEDCGWADNAVDMAWFAAGAIAHGAFKSAISRIKQEFNDDLAPDAWVMEPDTVELQAEHWCHCWANDNYQDYIENYEPWYVDEEEDEYVV